MFNGKASTSKCSKCKSEWKSEQSDYVIDMHATGCDTDMLLLSERIDGCRLPACLSSISKHISNSSSASKKKPYRSQEGRDPIRRCTGINSDVVVNTTPSIDQHE